MATGNKQNPFGLLNFDSEGEDDVQTKSKPKKQPNTNKEVKETNVKKPTNTENAPKQTQNVKGPATEQNQAEKEKNVRPKEPRKNKGIPAEPHPQDRHSGTGINPFDKKPKRAGGGKYNVGTIKDELNPTQEEQATPVEETPKTEEVVVEEKDTSITLSEYYKIKGLDATESAQTINENKAKITADQLVKELGTATPLQTRLQKQIDDKEVPKKKKGGADHAVGINTDHAELLGFKTGFKLYTDRPQEKRVTPVTTTQPVAQEKKEGETEQVKSPEGDAETQNQTEQPQQQQQQQGKKPYNKGGYNKGPRRDNAGYQKKIENKAPPKVDDDSSFPKLS